MPQARPDWGVTFGRGLPSSLPIASVRPVRPDKASIGRRLRIDRARGAVRSGTGATCITGPKISSREMRRMAIAWGDGPKPFVMAAPPRVRR